MSVFGQDEKMVNVRFVHQVRSWRKDLNGPLVRVTIRECRPDVAPRHGLVVMAANLDVLLSLISQIPKSVDDSNDKAESFTRNGPAFQMNLLIDEQSRTLGRCLHGRFEPIDQSAGVADRQFFEAAAPIVGFEQVVQIHAKTLGNAANGPDLRRRRRP